MNEQLNLPVANVKLKGNQIWDRLRKKYVLCTPEEWVRQHFVAYLIDHLNYPEGRMASEYTVNYNGMKKRCDVVGFNADFSPSFIVECKASSIAITEDTFFQIAKYTRTLQAKMLMLTNGINHYCAIINETGLRYLEEIPSFKD